MAVIQLPVGRSNERAALRRGLADQRPPREALRVVEGRAAARPYCASCAAPIEFGAVVRGGRAFCSIECSLGGDRPA